jgi:hypothetical protein
VAVKLFFSSFCGYCDSLGVSSQIQFGKDYQFLRSQPARLNYSRLD